MLTSTAEIPSAKMNDPEIQRLLMELDQIVDKKSPDIDFLLRSIEGRLAEIQNTK